MYKISTRQRPIRYVVGQLADLESKKTIDKATTIMAYLGVDESTGFPNGKAHLPYNAKKATDDVVLIIVTTNGYGFNNNINCWLPPGNRHTTGDGV